MELDKLSIELERSLQEARDFAEKRAEKHITPRHLLYVMLDHRVVLRALAERQGARPQLVLDQLSANSSYDDGQTRLEPGERAIADTALRDQIDRAFQVAEKRRSQFVEAIDVVMAVLEDGDAGLRKLLRDAGFSLDAIRKGLESQANATQLLNIDQRATADGSLLAKYSRDLTEMARQGKL